MGKKDKNKKKGKGAEKTTMKTDKKLVAKQKKLIAKLGEVSIPNLQFNKIIVGRLSYTCQPRPNLF